MTGRTVCPNWFTVRYTFIDGTAKAGEDYLATNGTLEFAPLARAQAQPK